LIPATSEKDAAYRNVPLQQDTNSNTGEVTSVFNTFWSGHQIPKKNCMVGVKKAVEDGEGEERQRNGGDIWYVESRGVGMWVTEWRCKLPISEWLYRK
jgi:hypothetical protein